MKPNMNELFQSMYDEYRVMLRIKARHYGIPYDEVDDIVQEIFISYFGSDDMDEGKREPTLRTILKNKCIDYHRKIHYEKVSMDSEEGRIIIDRLMSGPHTNIIDDIGKRELCIKVRECISEMRDDWREVIYYCSILQYNSEEAGKILGLSGTACRSRLLRAREYIRKKLGKEFHEYYD